MKQIFKLLPAALGLIALTSCSSDDLFGDSQATVDLSDKIVMNVTEEDGDITRTYRDFDQKVAYEVGDQLRVYDSKLQAYDDFAYAEAGLAKPTFILTADAAKVAEVDGKLDYGYAVFGSPAGDPNVSYAGWKDGYNLALMKIEPTFGYKEEIKNTATGDNQVVYRATLPQFGTVTPSTDAAGAAAKAAKSFDTSLKWLTGRAKVVFENGQGAGVQAVKVTAYRFAAGSDAADKTINTTGIIKPNATEKANIVLALVQGKDKALNTIQFEDKNKADQDVTKTLMTNNNKPLSGWFEAVLDPSLEKAGLRKVTDNTGAVDPDYKNYIQINVENAAMLDDYTNVFFFPIIPDTYDVLLFEYEVGGVWKVLTAYTGEVARAQKLEGELFTKQTALVSEYDDVETTIRLNKIIAQNATASAPTKLIINNGGGIFATQAGDATLNTITIPQLKNNMTIEIHGATDLTANALTITDAAGVDNSKYTVTFNFVEFKGGAVEVAHKSIVLNTTAKVAMEGTYKEKTAGKLYDVAITSTKTAELSLGTTDNPIIANAVAATAGEVWVVNNTSTIEALTSTPKVNAVGGTITALNANSVDVGGATVENLNLAKASKGNIYVLSGTVENLTLADNDADIVMDGGKIQNIKKPAADLTANRKIAVTTSGPALINTDTDPENFGAGKKVYNYTYESTYTENTVGAAANDQAHIYTAAQLASVGMNATPVTNYVLYTNVEIDDEANFASLTLDKTAATFAGASKTITIEGLDAPLFSTLGSDVAGQVAVTVSNLILKDAVIVPANAKDQNGFGILAKTADLTQANVSVTDVVIDNGYVGLAIGAAGSKSSNYGLMFGIAEGGTKTLTFTDCFVGGKVEGYYNLGGFIGETNSALTVDFARTANTASTKSVTINKTFITNEAEDDNAGKVGNFIGSINLTGATIKIGDGTNGKAFTNFFAADNITTDEHAVKVLVGETYKNYQGMANHEIGLSVDDAIAAVANFVPYGTAIVAPTAAEIAKGNNTLTRKYINIYNW